MKATKLVFFFLLLSLALFGFSKQFRFVVFGDNRPFNNEDPQPVIFKEIVENVEWIHPDFVVDVGDLIYGYGANAQRMRQEYTDFLSVVKKFSMPFYTIVGNHEVTSMAGQKDYETFLNRPLYYSFNHDGSHFVILDTNVNFAEGKFTQAQYDWLAKDLESATSAENIFIFMHKPLHEYFDPDQTAWTDKIMAKKVDSLINEFNSNHHNIKIVFQGHEHLYWQTNLNGITYMITGGAGAPLDAEPQNGGFYHFIMVTVNGTHVEVHVFLPNYFNVEYRPKNDGRSNSVSAVIENRLPSVYNGLLIKGLKFVMPKAPSYEVKGNVPCKIWKVVRNNDKTADVWVEAKLEFNDLSMKGLLKAALSIFSSRSLENVSRAVYNVITVSAKF